MMPVLRWLALCSLATGLASCDTGATPSQFYVITEAFSDAGPHWFHYILDVTPDSDGSLVRYIRIAPLDAVCGGVVTVKAVEVHLPGKTPAQMVAGNNPCATRPAKLRSALHKYQQHAGYFETAASGIVAQCGLHQTVLNVPYPEEVKFDLLKKDNPQMAALWDFGYQVKSAAFGDADIFHNISEQRDWDLQIAGQALLPELRTGRFANGFQRKDTLQGDLSGYKGPVRTANQTAKLLNADSFRFAHYVETVYPSLAQTARIQGNVELEFTVNPKTGEVADIISQSGHPLLKPAALFAVKRWCLVPNTASSEPMKAVWQFTLRCP